jgi:MoaA/NifB/PqqE/SkfB family radical SAM enzyme
MSEECFERVLSELAKVRDDWEFHPYFRNDPLCDPDILRRTRRIKQVFPESFVRLTTNGDALNDSESIIETLNSGVDSIFISHYDGPLSEIHTKVDKDFPRVVHHGKRYFDEIFYNRAGLVDVEYRNPKHDRCSLPFVKVYILWNGDIVLCCSDFYGTVVFGNIMKNGIEEIWDSYLWRRYRIKHMAGMGRDMLLCDKCDILT